MDKDVNFFGMDPVLIENVEDTHMLPMSLVHLGNPPVVWT